MSHFLKCFLREYRLLLRAYYIRACISAKAEAGSGLALAHTRPADILASNWLSGKPATFDLSETSPIRSLRGGFHSRGQQQLTLS